MAEHSKREPKNPGMPEVSLVRLYYFTVLAEELNFVRAAARLYLTQPGLSQQVKILERELGVVLFDRGRHETRLTPAGELLHSEVPRLLHDIEKTVELVRAWNKGYTGQLRVAYTRSATYLGPTRAVDRFRKVHPEVQVRASEGWTAFNIEMLRAHSIDVAFLRLPVHDQDIECVNLLEEELVVALPPRHRLVAQPTIEREALQDEDIVLWPRELGSGYYDRIVSQIWGNGRPRIAIEEPDDGEILAAVANGGGIAIVELHRAMQLLPSAVVLRHFAEPVPTTSLGVAWLHGYSSPLVEAFIAICRQVIRAS